MEQLQSHIWGRASYNIWENAVSHIWLCNCSLLNFLIYEEKFLYFFISVQHDSKPHLYRKTELCAGCKQWSNYKEILLKKLLIWSWAVSMAPIVQIFNRWVWPKLLFLSQTCVSLVMANESEIAFFWSILPSKLRYTDWTRLHRKSRLEVSLRLKTWDFSHV